MANPLTGDFPASFQVSGGTINRLLASMHQNNWEDDWTPSLPHALRLRVGDDQAIDGIKGLVEAQIGVPRIGLHHGSTDRFGLEVGVRASFEPDVDSEPLADFIHGTVTAEHRLSGPDPSWPGWGKVGSGDYLIVQVVEGSVGFRGTAATGWGGEFDFQPDPETVIPLVTNQIAHVLATRLQAAPIPAGSQFRPGALRSLTSAVTGPVALGADGGGQIASLDTEWLAGRDVGVALSREFVMAAVDASLAPLRGLTGTVEVDLGLTSTVYRLSISAATAEWAGLGDHATITLRVTGSATTNFSLAPDVRFTVAQGVDLRLDPSGASLALAAGEPGVTADAGGHPAAGVVEDMVERTVKSQVRGQVGAALASAASGLAGFPGRDSLGAGLRALDRFAAVHFDAATFDADGIAVRGTAKVSPRKKPVVKFGPTADRTAFTALATWVPGGEVERLHWSWFWERPPESADDQTEACYADRFLLKGRVQAEAIKFPDPDVLIPPPPIHVISYAPLPGLDGTGGVLLSVRALVVDERSGDLVRIETPAEQIGFGGYTFPWELPPGVGDVYWTNAFRHDLHDPFHGVLRRATSTVSPRSTNTLIVTQRRGLTLETLETLERGLTGHGRPDAGLLTVTAFGEGEASTLEEPVVTELGRLERELTTPVVAAETVGSALWDGLAVTGETAEPSWRLISPGGSVAWMHDGPLEAGELTAVLEGALRPCPPPAPEMSSGGPAAGLRLWEAVTEVEAGPDGARQPPPPMGRHGDGPAVAVFVDGRSDASLEQLKRLQERGPEVRGRAGVAVFVNGDLEEIRALNARLGETVDAIPDPGGAIADRLGVRAWPTTVTLDEGGAVVESWVGVDSAPLDAPRPGNPTA